MNFKYVDFPIKQRVSAETESGEIVYGMLTYLAFDFGRIKKGFYVSNSSGAPFARKVLGNTINIIDYGKGITPND